ncbi:replication protein [Bacillus sp. 1P02SD]|uniref:replication protein n=1 Tax=Bacillus sp. 1P02SD TaxID=3132264 RepID=UPI00399F784F
MKVLADVQLEKGYIRIATELMDEIIRRDFSKRQLAILHLIIRLSYGCHQKDCLIDKMNVFEIVGIYKGDIKRELDYLVEAKVIKWDKNENIFSVNKNHEMWKIDSCKRWDKQKLDYLIHNNLKRKKVSETLTKLKKRVSKTLTEMGEKVSKTLTDKLVKHLLEMFPNDWESKDESTLKDSIKDILKILKEGGKELHQNDNPTPKELIINKYLQRRAHGFDLTPEDEQAIDRLLQDNIPSDKILLWIDEIFDEFKPKHRLDRIKHFKYLEVTILDKWVKSQEPNIRTGKHKKHNEIDWENL